MTMMMPIGYDPACAMQLVVGILAVTMTTLP